MSDESPLGLLLRAHARCSEQKHGEEFVFQNVSASACWEQAVQSIESAIRSIGFAENYCARADAEKKAKK
jgi:hypothetical protein